ncbi:GNAT family N-acetyltransferase [Streptomyces sp. NPDC048606]|uniref:GNAT family N-acetyltransferase n=1 Tax=Streptomyces sp. NPDC048606 TaxID=3154726 RepID=UPI00343D2BFA
MLDNPAWASLSGAHAPFAERTTPPHGWETLASIPGVQLVDTALRPEPAPEAVVLGPRERGEVPFLHTAASNTNAIRLYESIGFTLRRRPNFLSVRAPETPPPNAFHSGGIERGGDEE